MTPRIPRIAQWLLGRLLYDEIWQTPLGDFEEFFADLVRERGVFKARIWYWSQVFYLLPRKIGEQLQIGVDMIGNYLKMTWRHFNRRRFHGLLNLCGLTVGMTAALLILLWVRDEMSFDRFHKNGDLLYRIVADWDMYHWDGLEMAPAPLADKMAEELPEIAHVSRYWQANRRVFRAGDRFFYERNGVYVDADFFRMYSFPFLQGSIDEALNQPDAVVITARMATKYFGENNPMGRTIHIENEPFRVSGVIADIPVHSTVQFDYAQGFEFQQGASIGWNAFQFMILCQLKTGSDPAAVGPKLDAIAKAHNSWHVKNGVRLRLQPLKEMHLDARSFQLSTVQLGDSRLVKLFAAVAAFIVLIACMNFINLSTAQAMQRSREVGLRKTLGARRAQLMGQFFGESLFYSLLAVGMAIVLTALLLPVFNQLTGKTMLLRLNDSGLWMTVLGLLFFSGLLSGIYPAVLLSSFKPLAVLKSTPSAVTRGAGFRRVLVVIQFALVIILLVGTTAIFSQIRFIQSKSIGLDKENVVAIPLKAGFSTRYAAVKTELLALPGVHVVTGAWNDVSRQTWRGAGWQWEGRPAEGEREVDIIQTGVDFDFFATLKLPLVHGRDFNPAHSTDSTAALILNEAAIAEMGLESPVGKWFKRGKKKYTIIGIAANANFRSLKQEIDPRMYFICPMTRCEEDGQALIRLSGLDMEANLASIESIWKRVNPHTPFEYRLLDTVYSEMYQQEHQVSVLLNLLTGLTIFIASLGLFGLASFILQRRTKELGIRKVLGAGELTLWRILAGQFVRWVAVANVVAFPFGYWLIQKALSGYAYRISLTPWMFIAPGLVALCVAVVTVSVQTVRAARIQPVKALRQD